MKESISLLVHEKECAVQKVSNLVSSFQQLNLTLYFLKKPPLQQVDGRLDQW